MSGGFTKIKLMPVQNHPTRMFGAPANPFNPTHIANVINPLTGEVPTSMKQALEFIAGWNERQTMYTYHLLNFRDDLWFPKRDGGKRQTTFELELETEE